MHGSILFADEHDRATKRQKKQIAKLVLKLPLSNDLPMTGRLTRESRKRDDYGWHHYVLSLRFKPSRRHYLDENIYAKDKKAALKLAARMHPNAKIK